MNAEAIATKLGDAQNQGRGWWHACCPVCGRSKLALHDADDGGLIAQCFHGCAGKDVYDALRGQKLLAGRADPRRCSYRPTSSRRAPRKRL